MTGADFVASCPTPEPRTEWDPPVWTFGNGSVAIDVNAATLDAAKTAAADAYDAIYNPAPPAPPAANAVLGALNSLDPSTVTSGQIVEAVQAALQDAGAVPA